MSKVSLPINTKPDIRAYMGEVIIFSILDFKDFAEDIRFSNPVFTANETTYNADNISMEQQGVEVVNNNNEFIISSKQHLEKKYANFYWESLNVPEGILEFTVQFKQRLDVFKQIKIKVQDGYFIDLYSNGQVRVYINDAYYDDYFINNNLVDVATRFCFEFSEKRLKIQYTTLEKQKELCNIMSDFSIKNLKICITPACHPMYNILYNNFIQLSMPVGAAGPTYCHGIGTHKIFHNVLSSFEINQDYLENYPTRLDFIKETLERGHYISMPADEYYVPNRYSYRERHYIHPNIIHSFNDQKRTINMLGYKGVLEDAEVSYEEAEKALTSENIKRQYYSDFMIHRKNYRCYPEYFNLKTVVRTLEEYRDGVDSYAHYGNVERHNVKEGRIYGLKIYDEILSKEDVFQKFMRDRRCSYIMAEHKRIMLKRLAYLNDNGILKNEEYVIHKDNYEEISRLAEQVCLLVVKNRIQGSEQVSIKVRDVLKKIKEKETIDLGGLIKDLKGSL